MFVYGWLSNPVLNRNVLTCASFKPSFLLRIIVLQEQQEGTKETSQTDKEEKSFFDLRQAVPKKFYFGMAAMPFTCNGILLIHGNLPRILPMSTLR